MFRRADILWDQLRSGIWPLPAGMMVGGVLLFRLALWVDQHGLPTQVLRSWWLHSGSAEDARSLMSTLVSAMITMASLVFSITVVTLTLAASQFGSRLVRSYVRDAHTGFTLGLFVMTILYCLLGLRVVGVGVRGGEVPHFTVTIGLVLGVACVFAMLMFLHRVAQAIVADEVVRRVASELEASIDSLAPAHPVSGAAARDSPERLPATPLPLLSVQEGYVQAVRYDELLALVQADDGYLQLSVMAGQFVARGDAIASYARAGGRCERFEAALCDCILIGGERTPVQDLAYSMRHLVDVALRALSPGINDDNTALVVIDRLRGALSRLLKKQLPSGRHVDAAGNLRVVGPRYTHQDHIHHAFDAIRHAAGAHPGVVVTLVEALTKLMAHAPDEPMRRFLLEEAQRVTEAALEQDCDAPAREKIGLAMARAQARSRLEPDPVPVQDPPAVGPNRPTR